MNHTTRARIFLIFCSVGLIPIALSYGANPATTMDALFSITVDSTNLSHVLRAVMGLYVGMAALWLCGAWSASLTRPALIACAVFMLGLAAGRLLSFAIDGRPHWLLILYAGLELVLGLLALALLRSHHSRPSSPQSPEQ